MSQALNPDTINPPLHDLVLMNIQINNCNVHILDTEVDILVKATELITSLPANSTFAIWPDSIGRQILDRVGKAAKHPLVAFTLGSFKGYDLSEYLKPIINNDKITVTQQIPSKIDLAFISPRATTLDIAVIVANASDRPYKISTLVGEIGAAFGFEKEHAEADSKTTDSDQNVVVIDDLVSKTEEFYYIFKGDLYKDACAGVLENKLSIGGALLKKLSNKKVSALTDILSSSLLSAIQKPWTTPNFQWNYRSAKMAICQLAVKLQKKIADLSVADFKAENIDIGESDLQVYKKYVVDDIQSRIVTIDHSLFPKDHKIKAILFSPHPDDDVISAGAAVKSLAVQDNVEFHVTYCVSGNVSVPDSFVQAKIDKHAVVVKDDGTGNNLLGEQIAYNADPHDHAGKIHQAHYLTHENLTNEEAALRFSTGASPRAKGLLREVAASGGGRPALPRFDQGSGSRCDSAGRRPFRSSRHAWTLLLGHQGGGGDIREGQAAEAQRGRVRPALQRLQHQGRQKGAFRAGDPQAGARQGRVVQADVPRRVGGVQRGGRDVHHQVHSGGDGREDGRDPRAPVPDGRGAVPRRRRPCVRRAREGEKRGDRRGSQDSRAGRARVRRRRVLRRLRAAAVSFFTVRCRPVWRAFPSETRRSRLSQPQSPRSQQPVQLNAIHCGTVSAAAECSFLAAVSAFSRRRRFEPPFGAFATL